MNHLTQNQVGFLGTFALLIDDAGDALTLASAGASHQSVTLATGDLVFVTGRSTATENGPYEFDGAGFVRCTKQDILRTHAGSLDGQIHYGSTFIVDVGTSAGKTFKVTSKGLKDSRSSWVNRVGTDDFTVVEAGGATDHDFYELEVGVGEPGGSSGGLDLFALEVYGFTTNSVVSGGSTVLEVFGDVPGVGFSDTDITFSHPYAIFQFKDSSGGNVGGSFPLVAGEVPSDIHTKVVAALGINGADLVVTFKSPVTAGNGNGSVVLTFAFGGSSIAPILGSIDGVNTVFGIDSSVYSDASLILVTQNDNVIDLDNGGVEGDPAGDYTFDPATGQVTFYQPPMVGDEVRFNIHAVKV